MAFSFRKFCIQVGQDSLMEGLRTTESCLYSKLTGQSPKGFKCLFNAHGVIDSILSF